MVWAAPKDTDFHKLKITPPFTNEVFQEAQQLYVPVTAPLEKKLVFEVEEVGHSSGGAYYDGETYKVVITRGLLESPRLTPDSFRSIICHELGHFFGGSPRRHAPPEWDGPIAEDGRLFITSEGQSDYYTTRSCFWRMVKGQDHRAALKGKKVPAIVQEKCSKVWGSDSESALVCQRAALSAIEFLNLNYEFPIAFETPDTHETEATLQDTYPDRQCRLDTLFAGALCKDAAPLKMDLMDASKSECTEKIGKRPRCWYK